MLILHVTSTACPANVPGVVPDVGGGERVTPQCCPHGGEHTPHAGRHPHSNCAGPAGRQRRNHRGMGQQAVHRGQHNPQDHKKLLIGLHHLPDVRSNTGLYRHGDRESHRQQVSAWLADPREGTGGHNGHGKCW